MFFYGKSDIGKKRISNQDAFDIREIKDGVWLCTVCDGMGGARGGNVASDLAMRTFVNIVSSNYKPDCDIDALLTEGVNSANKAVFEMSSSNDALCGMGTTLVAALIDGSTINVVNVGDSRMYYICGKECRQITKDHSFVRYLVDTGRLTEEEAETAPMKNVITRSVGNEEKTSPDLFKVDASDRGYILLCSDGLTNCVKKDKFLHVITRRHPISIKEDYEIRHKVNALIDLANLGGGTDNITAVLGKL